MLRCGQPYERGDRAPNQHRFGYTALAVIFAFLAVVVASSASAQEVTASQVDMSSDRLFSKQLSLALLPHCCRDPTQAQASQAPAIFVSGLAFGTVAALARARKDADHFGRRFCMRPDVVWQRTDLGYKIDLVYAMMDELGMPLHVWQDVLVSLRSYLYGSRTAEGAVEQGASVASYQEEAEESDAGAASKLVAPPPEASEAVVAAASRGDAQVVPMASLGDAQMVPMAHGPMAPSERYSSLPHNTLVRILVHRDRLDARQRLSTRKDKMKINQKMRQLRPHPNHNFIQTHSPQQEFEGSYIFEV